MALTYNNFIGGVANQDHVQITDAERALTELNWKTHFWRFEAGN